MTGKDETRRRLFPKRRRPLVLWRLPWKHSAGVKNLALSIYVATAKSGRGW